MNSPSSLSRASSSFNPLTETTTSSSSSVEATSPSSPASHSIANTTSTSHLSTRRSSPSSPSSRQLLCAAKKRRTTIGLAGRELPLGSRPVHAFTVTEADTATFPIPKTEPSSPTTSWCSFGSVPRLDDILASRRGAKKEEEDAADEEEEEEGSVDNKEKTKKEDAVSENSDNVKLTDAEYSLIMER